MILLDAAAGLFIPVIAIGCIAVVIYIYLKRREAKQKLTLESDLKKFISAAKRKDLQEIERIGMELLYNWHFGLRHMKQMEAALSEVKDWRSKIPELHLAIYNKKLKWKKGIPHLPY